jgi:hypothetical protein
LGAVTGSKHAGRIEEQPFFRFNPNAYMPGRAFERSDDACASCGLPCVWKYVGNIYGRQATVCAGCIATGSAERVLTPKNIPHDIDFHFALHDIDFEDEALPSPLVDEVLRQTPGIACFNPYCWPCAGGMPMAFIGYGEDVALRNDPAALEATRQAFVELNWDSEGPSAYALIFRELNGERVRAVIDLD